MIITCDECNSSFSINDSMIKDEGSKVRCSKCDNVFVAFPQSAEDIEDELTLDSEDQMPADEDDFGLDDLDSDFSAFLGDDEIEKTVVIPSETEELELDLDDFDGALDLESGLEPDDKLELSEDELELDLDFDQEDEPDPAMGGDSIDGDDLPDLAELDNLEDEAITSDGAGLEGLDLDLESDIQLDIEGDDELDLTDLGFEEDTESLGLEDSSALGDGASEAADSDELDLSDLETALAEESVPRETTQFDLDELDREPEAAETGEADLAVETSDRLNISDLDLEIEDAPVFDEAPSAGIEDQETEPLAGGDLDAGDELDLSDLSDIMEEAEAPAAEAQSEELDLDLGLESEAPTGAEEPGAVADSDDIDELDLSDLEEFVETEQAPAGEAQPEELDLDLGLENEAPTGAEAPAAEADSEDIDELNLSDLEEFIETEEAPTARAAADDSAQGLDVDLDSSMEDGAPMSEIKFDSQGDDELDFSDLEQMLESDETPSVEAAGNSTAVEELDLQFDLEQPPAAEPDTESIEASGEAPGADAQEDDFLDIEQLLEEGEDSAPAAAPGLDGDETDLPLEMEAALVEASSGADAELEIDFDLESELQADEDEDLFEIGASADEPLDSHLLASDEADFLEEAENAETEFQDPSETSVIGAGEFTPEDSTEKDTAYGATHMLSSGSEESEESEVTIADQDFEPYVPQKKSRSKKPLVAVMVLILLALGVFTVPNMLGVKIPYISDIKIPYLSDLDVKIPYLSQWLNPEPKDIAGNLKIIPLGNTINGKFVDNSKSGQLFVIQGQIKNDYDHPRSYIKVKGKLFRKGKKVAKTATVFCGNTLTKSDLRSMDIKAISKKLNNRTGSRRSNFKVKTGNRIPFMIVFDKLPRNLEEYTVEVESSSI